MPGKNRYKEVTRIDLIYLGIIIILSLLPITWFKNGCIINGGDFSFPFDSPLKTLSNYFYSWNSKIGLGIGFARGIAQLPYQLFLSLWDLLGFSLPSIEKIFFMTMFLLAGISMYFFCKKLTKNELVSFIASLFYIFNPFTMIVTWRMITLSIISYASLPLVCLTFIKSIENMKPVNLLYFNLVFLIFNSCSNPIFYLLAWFILFSYAIFLYWKEEYILKTLFKNISILFICNLIFNIWWVLPMLADISIEYSRAINSYVEGGSFAVLNISTSTADIVELLQLKGYWPFYGNFSGEPYYNYVKLYSTVFFKVIGFFIPVIVFSALLFNKKDKKLIIFLLISVLISIFILKGVRPPFGEVFYSLFFKIPFSGALRSPIDKIGILLVLSYSILFGISITGFYKFLTEFNKRRAVIVFISLLILIFFIYLFPFWTGEVIYDGGTKVPSFHVKVPEYYKKANDWIISQNEEFRMYPYPYLEQYFGNAYEWGYGYIGSNPSEFLFSKPLVCRTEEILPQIIFKSLEDKNYNAGELLGMIGVKYLIFFKDFSWRYHSKYFRYSPDYYMNLLKERKDLRLVKTFGKLEFYEIDKKYLKPYIYALRTDLNKEKILNLKFTKINPVKYIVDVNSEKQFYLIFNELYHKKWKAYIDGVEIKNHFLINSYANGYCIDKTGEFRIEIKYTNQNLFVIGSIITISNFFLLIFLASVLGTSVLRRFINVKKDL